MNIPDALQILALAFPGTVREITSRHVLDADDNQSEQWSVYIVARNGVPVDDALADNLGDAVRAVHGRQANRLAETAKAAREALDKFAIGLPEANRHDLEMAFRRVIAGGKVEAKLPVHTVEEVK